MKRFVRRRRIWALAAFLLAAPVVFLVVENLRGYFALQSWRSQMAAAGEEFRVENLAPTVPDEAIKNGERLVEIGKSLRELRKSCPLIEAHPLLMRFTGPAEARSLIGGATPEFALPSAVGDWESLRAQLDQGNSLLTTAKSLLEQPHAFAFDYSKGANLAIPGSDLHAVHFWLRADLLWHLHTGDHAGVLDSLRASMALARSFASIRTLIWLTMANGLKVFSTDALWSALQLDGWTDEQLQLLQKSLEESGSATSLVRAVEMERAWVPLHFAMLRESAEGRATLARMNGVELFPIFLDDSYEPPEPPPEYLIWLQGMLWRLAWSHQNELRVLRAMHSEVVSLREWAAKRAWLGSPMRAEKPDVRSAEIKAWRSVFAEALNSAPLVRSAAKTTVHVEIQTALGITAVALHRYRQRHGKWPETLDALVPDFVEAPPTDWADGQPLRYEHKEDGTFLLYSAGLDGADDGGDVRPTDPKKNPSFYNGRDIVWPQRFPE